MKTIRINICLATDKRYAQHAGCVIFSILRHSQDNEYLTFYILHEDLTAKEKETLCKITAAFKGKSQIKFIVPDSAKLPTIHNKTYITKEAFYRLQLPNLLKDIDRIIYVDCDVIAVSSLDELWQTELGDCILGGVADSNSFLLDHNRKLGIEGAVYINSGVLLIDLKKARDEDIPNKFLETADSLGERARLHDQDIINVTLRGKILILPLKWNLSTGYFKRIYEYQYYSDKEIETAVVEPAILHFSGDKKPWAWCRCRHFFWYEYFKILKHTPWWYKYWTIGIVKKMLFRSKKLEGPAMKFIKE